MRSVMHNADFRKRLRNTGDGGVLRSLQQWRQRLLLLPLYALAIVVSLSAGGCQEANHYYAENPWYGGRKLPENMTLRRQSNPQEVDLSRLAGGTGSSQQIGVGDYLEVQIAAGLHENDQSTTAVRVQEDGAIILPDIGSVEVAGLEPQAAEAMIQTEAVRQDLYQNPTVTVFVKQQKKNRVRVLGAVKSEGTYELSPNSSDVVSAIAAAGGLAINAGQKVEVRNPGATLMPSEPTPPPMAGNSAGPMIQASDSRNMRPASYTIDLVSAARSGEGQYLVEDGGIVMVEKRDPPPIFVQGLVRLPNQYEFPIGKDLRLLDAISLAGGMSNQMADKIFIVRQVEGQDEPVLIQSSWSRAKRSSEANLRLGPGDVISVEQTPGTVFMDVLNIIRFGVTGSTTLF